MIDAILNLRFWRTDQDKFADLVRGRLAATGETRPIRYDRSDFSLHVGTQDAAERQTVRLHNLFASFTQLSPAERPAALSRIVASIVESGRPMPASFSEAAGRLMPLVRPTTDIEMWRLQGRLDGRTPDADIPHRQLTPHIAALLALDGDETIAWIFVKHLADWGVTFDEAFATALTNLRRRSDKPFITVSPGLYGSDWADRYNPSRLLLTDAIAALPLKGVPVAMVPNRDALLVTGSEDEEGLRAMARLGQGALGDPRALSATALRFEAGTWRDFEPDPSQPGQTGLAELQEVQAGIDYAGQKALLDAIHIKAGEDIHVATHSCRRERETGRFAGSFTTWTEGADSLLPRAQSLVLVQLEHRRMIGVSWKKAVPILGDLLVPTGSWPERFRARRFPNDAQLEELRAVAEDAADLPPTDPATGAPLPGAQPFDASIYPQSYRMAPRWRRRWIFLSAVIIAAGLGGISYAVVNAAVHLHQAIVVAALSLAFILLAAYAIAGILKWRVTLLGDAVEVSGLWRTRRLARDEIKGYRLAASGNNLWKMELVPVDAGHKQLKLLPLQIDAPFAAWFSGLPDLHASDLRNSEAEIAANPAFGATPEDRLRRLTTAHKVARWFNYATIAALVWCFIAPQPYGLLIAVLAVLPPLALLLVVVSRGLFRIYARRADAHANLVFPFFFPGLALMVRVLLDLDMLDWVPAIAAGLIGGVVLVGIAAAADRNLRRLPWTMLGCALLAGVYGFGAIAEANALLDRSLPSVFASPVIEKHISRGKTTRHILRLAPWGPRTEAGDVTVPQALYDAVQPGHPVCVLLRQGWFGMRWFITVGCK